MADGLLEQTDLPGHVAANVYYLDTDLFVVMMLNRGDGQLPQRQLLEERLVGQ